MATRTLPPLAGNAAATASTGRAGSAKCPNVEGAGALSAAADNGATAASVNAATRTNDTERPISQPILCYEHLSDFSRRLWRNKLKIFIKT